MPKPVRKYHYWTPDDKAVLAALYRETPVRVIAARFGVSECEVRQVAHRLGLRRRRRVWDGEGADEASPDARTDALDRLRWSLVVASRHEREVRRVVHGAIELARRGVGA